MELTTTMMRTRIWSGGTLPSHRMLPVLGFGKGRTVPSAVRAGSATPVAVNGPVTGLGFGADYAPTTDKNSSAIGRPPV